MKKAMLIYQIQYKSEADRAVAALNHFGYECLSTDLTYQSATAYKRLEKDDFDLVVTFDMAGFEKGTQTGALFLNLLSCKTIHFLYGDKKEYVPYLANKLSLAMLFILLGEDENTAYRMKVKYPDIYYIKAFPQYIDMDTVFTSVFDEIDHRA